MKKFKVLMKIATVCLCCVLVFSLAGCFKSLSMTPKFDMVKESILFEMGNDEHLEYDYYNSEVGSCIVKVSAWSLGDDSSSDGFKFGMYWESEGEYSRDYWCIISFSRRENGYSSMYLDYKDENYGLFSDNMDSLKEDELVFGITYWKKGNASNYSTSGDAGPAKEYVSERLVSVKATFNSILQEIMDDADITIDDLYLYE